MDDQDRGGFKERFAFELDLVKVRSIKAAFSCSFGEKNLPPMGSRKLHHDNRSSQEPEVDGDHADEHGEAERKEDFVYHSTAPRMKRVNKTKAANWIIFRPCGWLGGWVRVGHRRLGGMATGGMRPRWPAGSKFSFIFQVAQDRDQGEIVAIEGEVIEDAVDAGVGKPGGHIQQLLVGCGAFFDSANVAGMGKNQGVVEIEGHYLIPLRWLERKRRLLPCSWGSVLFRGLYQSLSYLPSFGLCG